MPNGVQPPGRRLLIPTAGEYWPMDLTLDEERQRLRHEYADWSDASVLYALKDLGIDPAYIDRWCGLTVAGTRVTADQRARLRELLVDRVCPRAWLDRRLREEG